MSVLTTWGYTLTDVNAIPDILTADEYNEFTADKYAGDSRSIVNIDAAQAAIRNYCGWHVCPSLSCKLSTTFYDRRVTRVKDTILVQLPAAFVTDVSAVTIDGESYSTFVFETSGILRVYGAPYHVHPYTTIEVEYTAGVDESLAGALKELIAHRVTHALTSTTGVQSESAGGVSVTYNAAWTNNTRATALPDDNKEVLAPYRVKGVY